MAEGDSASERKGTLTRAAPWLAPEDVKGLKWARRPSPSADCRGDIRATGGGAGLGVSAGRAERRLGGSRKSWAERARTAARSGAPRSSSRGERRVMRVVSQ